MHNKKVNDKSVKKCKKDIFLLAFCSFLTYNYMRAEIK